MESGQRAELGLVQQTLFFPLLARARDAGRRRSLLHDEKAAELVWQIGLDPGTARQSIMTFLVVLRTMILDWWVRQFLAVSPGGTVIELGTGLNARFERTDNGSVHWIDLDLPDTIALRRRFFADTERRRMIAGSLLDEEWLATVEQLPGPYFFTADGVLPYLTENAVAALLTRLSVRFPGARIAFDSYPRKMADMEHKMAARRGIARWQWSCDDPRTPERYGLRLLELATPTRPPAGLRATLLLRYRLLLLAADPLLGSGSSLTLFAAAPR